jgi:hypothetical protein
LSKQAALTSFKGLKYLSFRGDDDDDEEGEIRGEVSDDEIEEPEENVDVTAQKVTAEEFNFDDI